MERIDDLRVGGGRRSRSPDHRTPAGAIPCRPGQGVHKERGEGPAAAPAAAAAAGGGGGGGPERRLEQPGRRAEQAAEDAVRHGPAAQVPDLRFLRLQAGV